MKRFLVVLVLTVTVSCGADFDDCPKKADGSLDCSHQDLSGESLQDADLSGADFSGADLSGADLKGADLRNANLSGLDLSGVKTLWEADLSGANLSGATLNRVDLRDVNLSGANLKGADLRNADFSDSWTKPEANLSGADLRNADLRNADLKGANLRDANLSGLDLSGLDLSESDLTGADLEGVTTDADTEWPEGFDSKAAGVITATTTTTTTTATTTTTTTAAPRAVLGPYGVWSDQRSEVVRCHNAKVEFTRHRNATVALANTESRNVDRGLYWYYLQLDLRGDYLYLLESLLECDDLFPEVFVLYIYTAIEEIDSCALVAVYPSDRSVIQECNDGHERIRTAGARASARSGEVLAWFESLTN
jgi:hypothetical protein